MKTSKLTAALLSVMAAAVLLTACARTPTPPDSATPSPSVPPTTAPVTESPQPRTLTDMTGREIILDKPITRIVAVTASDCEIVAALGAGDLLVGRGEYCDYPESILDVPTVQSGEQSNMEQIIALSPDAVFMGTMAQSPEQVAALEKAGIAVINSDARDIEGVYTAINMIGAALGREAEAQALVSDMQARFAKIAGQIPVSSEKPTVYFEVSPLEWGLWTAGSDTFMQELADLLGLENAFSDVTGWGEISQEQVINRSPDYIITVSMYYGEGISPEEEIAARPGWQTVTAVAEGHVYLTNSDEISRPGPRLADAAESLYALIYGEGK